MAVCSDPAGRAKSAMTLAPQYASCLRKALASGASADLERAFHSQRCFWNLIVTLSIAVPAMLARIVIPLLLVASHA